MTLSLAMKNPGREMQRSSRKHWAREPRDETFADGGVNGATRSRGLVRKAGEILLNKAFFEIYARVLGDDFFAHLHWKLIEPHPQHIEKNTGIEERHLGAHILRDAGVVCSAIASQTACT